MKSISIGLTLWVSGLRTALRVCGIGVALWTGILPAQTVINGSRSVKGAWDASGAASTKPVKTGTPLPAACSSGEIFFNTAAAAGQNLYLCQPDNSWTQLSATGGGGLSGTGSADQVAFFSGANTLSSDSKITRTSWGDLNVKDGDLVVGPDITTRIGGYSVGVGMRLSFRTVNDATCNSSAVSLTPANSHHRVNLNNQSTCAISWGDGDVSELGSVLLCQGNLTATTTLVWPANVRGGMAASGGPNTCMTQTFIFDSDRGAWMALGPGMSGI